MSENMLEQTWIFLQVIKGMDWILVFEEDWEVFCKIPRTLLGFPCPAATTLKKFPNRYLRRIAPLYLAEPVTPQKNSQIDTPLPRCATTPPSPETGHSRRRPHHHQLQVLPPTAFCCCCFSFLQVRDDPICILYWFFVFNTPAARSASICGCCCLKIFILLPVLRQQFHHLGLFFPILTS